MKRDVGVLNHPVYFPAAIFVVKCLSFSPCDAAVEREGPFLARRHLSSFSEVRAVVMYGRLQFFW